MFDFYTIDASYMSYLYSFDTEVYYRPVPSYSGKPYVGIVATVNNYNYFIPLTSAKNKHKGLKNTGRDYNLIYEYDRRKNLRERDVAVLFCNDSEGCQSEDMMKKILSMLDFRKAVPVCNGFYSKLNIRGHVNQDLLHKEYRFLLKKRMKLQSKARNLIQKQKADNTVLKMYCDFKLLEDKCKLWAKDKLTLDLCNGPVVEINQGEDCNTLSLAIASHGVIQPFTINTSVCGDQLVTITAINEFNDSKSISLTIRVAENTTK